MIDPIILFFVTKIKENLNGRRSRFSQHEDIKVNEDCIISSQQFL